MNTPASSLSLAVMPPSQGYSGRSRDPKGLALALVVTAAMFGFVLMLASGPTGMREASPSLMLFEVIPDDPREAEQPKPEPVNQREILADTKDESSPAAGPRTIVAAPDLPTIPIAAIDLSPIDMPDVAETSIALVDTDGALSEGDQITGPEGLAGTGGDGIAGDGLGGAGSGKGGGNKLKATWAPSMNFARLDSYFPQQARGTGITGHALLKCMALRRDRVRDCSLLGEKPKGYGFGKAALRSEHILRLQVHNQVGRRVYNEWVIFEAVFRPSDHFKRKPSAQVAQQNSEGKAKDAEPKPTLP